MFRFLAESVTPSYPEGSPDEIDNSYPDLRLEKPEALRIPRPY